MATAGDIMETGSPSSGAVPAVSPRPRFTWRYDHKVDTQGRVPMPAKWRPEDPSTLSLMAVMIRHAADTEFVMVLPSEQFDRFSQPTRGTVETRSPFPGPQLTGNHSGTTSVPALWMSTRLGTSE